MMWGEHIVSGAPRRNMGEEMNKKMKNNIEIESVITVMFVMYIGGRLDPSCRP
jgi:hypothetical protein